MGKVAAGLGMVVVPLRPGAASLWSRTRDASAGWDPAHYLLSPQPSEHEHRKADARDVGGDLPPRTRDPRRGNERTEDTWVRGGARTRRAGAGSRSGDDVRARGAPDQGRPRVSFAFIASWDPRWISDHEEWLRRYGPHRDGWMVKLSPASVHCLREQIRTEGFFRFYALAARGKGGDGLVHRAFHVTRFVPRETPVPFRHDRRRPGHTHHGARGPGRANALFTYA